VRSYRHPGPGVNPAGSLRYTGTIIRLITTLNQNFSTGPPLILTVGMNEEAQAYFNELRRRHFPPSRNFLQAHLTLFHHLPAGDPEIRTALSAAASERVPIAIRARGIHFMGRGVAIRLESPELTALHRQLQKHWLPCLIPQDRQALWPHITIQNKEEPEVARALFQELSGSFEPFTLEVRSLDLWEYHGGPWEFKERFPFRQEKQQAGSGQG
jgi:2'-5' RNA ligase